MSMDPERFEAAGARFVAFFNELGRTFVEREELLAQVALALLSREHVLMTGPPGTAKSGVASAVLRRVVDEKTGAAEPLRAAVHREHGADGSRSARSTSRR